MAVAFAIGAALAWGMADFLAGLATRRLGVLTVLLLLEVGGLIVMVSVCAIVQPALPELRLVLLAVGAGLVGVVGLGLFYQAMAIGTVSVVAPISAAGAVLPVAVGVAGGDRPSMWQWLGLVTIIVGVMLASREQQEDLDAQRRGRHSVLLALLSATCFGMFYVLSDPPAERSVLWTVTLVRLAPLPILLVAWLARRARRPGRRDALVLVAIGLIDLAATALITLANASGALSIVAVLGAMYPVVTVLLAALVLHERVLRSQYVGVVLALGGVGLVAGG